MIDLGLNDDQRQLADGAAGLLAQHRAAKDAHGELAAWGWFGAGLPEDRGGLGLGIAGEALLYLEAGRFLLPPSMLAATLAAHLAADPLPPARAALALVAEGEAFVFERRGAAQIVAIDGDTMWLAPAEAFRGAPAAGFDESVPVERGALDRAARGTEAPAERARLLVAAMLAGIAGASCELAVGYAKVREQFGRPIGAFQAVKHICADMGMRAYAAEAQVKMAAAAATDAPGDAAPEIAAAALVALKGARANAEDAIQVHGGIGFTAACDAHRYLKRAHLLGRMLGGPDACRDRVLAPGAGHRQGGAA